MSPEVARDYRDAEGKPNKWGINNLTYFTALRIAIRNGYTHILYLEADCRVGRKEWDNVVFEEYFSQPQSLICGGTLVTYNPSCAGPEGFHRWNKLMEKNTRRNFPISCFGFKGAADSSGSSVFPNGALGIYDLAWMQKLFELSDSGRLAAQCFAWDFEIGDRIWKLMGPKAYDCVAHLESIYSSYGDVLSSEHERLEMVRSGKVVACHQVKSSASI